MERRNNQMNLSAKPYVSTHQQNQGIEVIYESKRGGGYRRGGKRKNYQTKNEYYGNNEDPYYQQQSAFSNYYNNDSNNYYNDNNYQKKNNKYGNSYAVEVEYNPQQSQSKSNAQSYNQENNYYRGKKGKYNNRQNYQKKGYQNYQQPQQKRETYQEVEVDYAPKEIVEEVKAKGKGKIIVKEITGDEGQVFKEDLMDDYHEFNEGDVYHDDLMDEGGDDFDEGNYNDDNYYKEDTYQESSTTQSTTSYNSKTKFKNPLTFTNSSGFTEKVEDLLKGSRTGYYNQDITDSFVNVLMVAEKPSIARMISEVLSNGKAREKKIGKGKCIITFDGYFKNSKAKFTVSAVAGHVYTSDFLREHNQWDAVDAVDLYDVPIVKLEAMKKSRMPEMLQRMGSGKDILCLWLDCDKEGENICYEVIYNVYPQMNKKKYQQIYRAKFSSLTKKDLKHAFDNLCDPPNKFESLSVDCRQVIDLKIGVSFTRFLTSSILPGLDVASTVLSYGPCQTPTLWFCVNRQKEIQNFKPKEYFRPFIEIEVNKMKHIVKYPKNIYDKNELMKVMNKLKDTPKAKVKEVIINHNTKAAPAGLNTVSLLRVASSFLKMSPHNTMVVAEKLYTMGYITYPRTETTKYASSFDFVGTLSNFKSHPVFGKNITSLLNNFRKPSLKGVDMGDHPPITPSRVGTSEQLKGDYWKLYEFICTHFFASCSQAAEYDNVTYKIEVAGEGFEESSMNLTNEGFLTFLTYKKGNYQKDFPILKKDSEFLVTRINYTNDWTEPPTYLTESDLIKEMEKNKIGTDASMPVHIENICQRGYVKVDEGRKLIPTKLGKALIDALGEVDPEIIHPDNRAKIEGFVDEVAHGKKKYEDVLKYALDLYKEKYLTIRVHYDKLLKAFGKYFSVDTSKMAKAFKNVRAQNEKYKSQIYVQKK